MKMFGVIQLHQVDFDVLHTLWESFFTSQLKNLAEGNRNFYNPTNPKIYIYL
jgi:hypothetical protein